ncbi:MAG: hypothetical protein KY475_17755 [Planctomycetes bacterium]|nr:hypothetical protein [Planctomycetota bacterium]
MRNEEGSLAAKHFADFLGIRIDSQREIVPGDDGSRLGSGAEVIDMVNRIAGNDKLVQPRRFRMVS